MVKKWRTGGGAEALAKGFESGRSDILFGDAEGLRDTSLIRLGDISPNDRQVRRFFDHDELEHLAESLRIVGQLAPVLVKPHPTEPRRYLLVAGERRWRAAAMAGMNAVAAHILDADADIDQVALIENLQRVNLSAVEEAEGVQRLIERHNYSQEQAGALLGKSRTEINTTLSLLRLHPSIRQACVTSHTHLPKAALLELARTPFADQLTVWDRLRREELSVREIRALRRGDLDADAGADDAGAGGPEPGGEDAGAEIAVPRRRLTFSRTRFIAGLPKLQQNLDAGLASLEAERRNLTAEERDSLRGLRSRLESYGLTLDRILGKDA
jgi:ParB family transcriptional regulator, chromosome partitioning protein